MSSSLLGRYHVDDDDVIWGGPDEGLMRARDDAGHRYLVSVLSHYHGRAAAMHDDLTRLVRPGVARVVEHVTDANRLDILVEEEPPGRSSYETPPLAPSHARRLAIELGALMRDLGPGVRGIRPELVYLRDGELSGIAPRYPTMAVHNNPTLTGGLALLPMGSLSREEAQNLPLTGAHDAYALASMIRFWQTGAPLVVRGADDALFKPLIDIIEGRHLFHYDGPLADIVDAGLGGAPFDELLDRLASARVDDSDHAMRTRLIAEVVANPDDDGPRLVLADYLLERGDPRGELIQAQCSGQPVDALLAAHGTRWSAHLCEHVNEAFFDRGFVAMVRGADRGAFERRRDALLAFGPLPRID